MAAAGGAQGNDQGEGGIVIAGGELRHVVLGHQHIESQTIMSHTYNPVGTSGIAVEPGTFAIQSNILVHELNPISTSSRVFNAELRSGVTGTKPIVVKLTPHGPKFLREAKIHFSVPHHKNIVERIATDFFNFRGAPTIFIAMERCDCSLHDHVQSELRDEVAFNSAKYTWISYQILVALDFLHSHGVVHGDLKPSNVLLILNRNIVKLSDFGLSRAITDGHDSTQITSPQGGTSGWLSPESLEGTTQISKPSDIFPCGLVFHFTWSHGKHAYGDRAVSRNHYILEGTNQDLSRMLIDFVDEATALLERMFQHKPADRPTTAEILQNPIFERFGPQKNNNRINNAQVLEVFNPPTANEKQVASDSSNIIEGGKQPTEKELHTIICKAVKHMECQGAEGGNKKSTTDEKTALGVTVEQIANAMNKLKLSRKVRKVKALFGYDGMRDDELSFKEGAIFQLLDDFKDGWSEGLLDGKRGNFPRLYVRPLEEDEEDVEKPMSATSNNSGNTGARTGTPLCQQGCGLILTSHLSSDSKHLAKLSSELFGTTTYNPTGEFISESNRKAIQKRLSNMKTCNDGITMIIMAYSHSLKVYDALMQDNLKKFLEDKGLSDDECVARIKDIRNNLAVFNFRPGGRYLGQDAAKIAINICLTKDKNEETGKLQTTVKNGCTVDKITFQESQGTGSWLGPDVKHFVNNVEVMEFVKRKLCRLGIAEFCKQHQVEKQTGN